MELWYKCSLI